MTEDLIKPYSLFSMGLISMSVGKYALFFHVDWGWDGPSRYFCVDRRSLQKQNEESVGPRPTLRLYVHAAWVCLIIYSHHAHVRGGIGMATAAEEIQSRLHPLHHYIT